MVVNSGPSGVLIIDVSLYYHYLGIHEESSYQLVIALEMITMALL